MTRVTAVERALEGRYETSAAAANAEVAGVLLRARLAGLADA